MSIRQQLLIAVSVFDLRWLSLQRFRRWMTALGPSSCYHSPQIFLRCRWRCAARWMSLLRQMAQRLVSGLANGCRQII